LALSRRCRTALPPLAAVATERASGRRPQGTGRAHPNHIAVRARQPMTLGRHVYQLRNSCPFAAHHPQDHARRRDWHSPGISHRPGLTERQQTVEPSTIVTARSTASVETMPARRPHPRSRGHRRVDRHIDAPERAAHLTRIVCDSRSRGAPWMYLIVRNKSRS